jgi:hypothetical protein
MSTPLPIIRGTSSALYPFNQVYTCQTEVSDSEAGVPSRWPIGFPRLRFEFAYNPVTQAQKNTLKGSFNSAKGQFTGGGGSAGLTVTTDLTYTDLSFDSDEFAAIEQITTQYGVRWSLNQSIPQNLSPGASGGAYPLLAIGAMSLLPYTQRLRFQNIVSEMPSGPKYTYAEFGAGGLFPAGGLMGWTLDEPSLEDVDVNTKVAHFLANWGNAFSFSFTDEDAVTYSNVYYASPVMTISRQDFNRSRITTNLVQMN